MLYCTIKYLDLFTTQIEMQFQKYTNYTKYDTKNSHTRNTFILFYYYSIRHIRDKHHARVPLLLKHPSIDGKYTHRNRHRTIDIMKAIYFLGRTRKGVNSKSSCVPYLRYIQAVT